jgi:O-antigen ligase
VLRAAAVALVAAMVLGWVAAGRAGRGRAVAAPRWNALDVAVLAWVVAGIAGTLAGISPRLSLLGEIEQREGVVTTLALAALYVAARRGHSRASEVGRTFDVLLAAAALAAAYALLQRAGLDPLRWENPALYPAGNSLLVRPSSTLGNSIPLGVILATALAVTAARLAAGRGDLATHGPLAALFVIALLATLSRGGWLAAVTGVGAALGWAWAHGTPRRRVGATFAGLALAAGIGVVVATPHGVASRLVESGQTQAVSLPARVELARASLALLGRHPWLGVGPDAFGLAYPAVQSPELWRIEWLGFPVHAHSAVFQILATLGLFGVAAGVFWIAALIQDGRSRWRESAGESRSDEWVAALASLAASGLVNPLGLAGAATFVVVSGLRARDDSAPPSAPLTAGRAIAGVAALAALATVFLSSGELRSLGSASRARAALLAAIEGDPRGRNLARLAAVDDAARAAVLAPREDELARLECDARLAAVRVRLATGEVAIATEQANSAEAAAHRALRLEPRRASNYQRLGNALATRAAMLRAAAGAAPPSERWEPLAARAEAAFDQAQRLAPSDALILTDRVSAELSLGRNALALEAAQRIVSMYPAAASGYALEGAALLGAGRLAEARAALLRARDARWEAEDAPRRAAVDALLRDLSRADSVNTGGNPR